jgi:sodium/potassium-transporting ATPase subunit alpha
MYIVSILQKMGHMVTVTGDGTNDSTALKLANCGICMGSGTDIAKDCADIIISDDDFNKILEGIEEGRKIFDNLKKAIVYVMTSQISEWMPFVVLIFSKIPIPIFTLLIDAPVDFVTTVAYVY